MGECANCGGCTGCGAACGGCSGCAGTLYLTAAELDALSRFGEIPFWPLVRRAGAEEAECPDFPGNALKGLAFKGLIRLDEDLPLTNYDYSAYGPDAHRGSCALTAAGIRAVELLEIAGAEE